MHSELSQEIIDRALDIRRTTTTPLGNPISPVQALGQTYCETGEKTVKTMVSEALKQAQVTPDGGMAIILDNSELVKVWVLNFVGVLTPAVDETPWCGGWNTDQFLDDLNRSFDKSLKPFGIEDVHIGLPTPRGILAVNLQNITREQAFSDVPIKDLQTYTDAKVTQDIIDKLLEQRSLDWLFSTPANLAVVKPAYYLLGRYYHALDEIVGVCGRNFCANLHQIHRQQNIQPIDPVILRQPVKHLP